MFWRRLLFKEFPTLVPVSPVYLSDASVKLLDDISPSDPLYLPVK
jgi:hypothetical protein